MHLIKPIYIRSLVFVAVLVALVSGCGRGPSTNLRVGANIWPGYEPLFLARSLGYYDGKSIQLVDIPSTTEVISAFRNRAIDVAAVTLDEAMLLAETTADLNIILVCDFSNGADVVLAKPQFQSMKDLKGRRIGVETGALGAFMLARSLESAGLTTRDVTVVPVTLDFHEAVYHSNRVDAIITFEPRRSRLIASGARQVFDSSKIPGEITDVLVTRHELVTANNPALTSMVRGWFKALDYLKQNPADAAQRLAGREQVTPAEFLESLKLLELPDRQANLRLLGGTTNNLSTTLHRLSGLMVEHKLLTRPPDPATFLSDHFLRAATP